jgi:hypothetical protein
VEANEAIEMQMKAIMTLTLTPELSIVPMIATMNWQVAMARAPQRRMVRRPNRSIIQKEMGVERTLTRVVMRPMRKGLEIVPSCWKKVVPK